MDLVLSRKTVLGKCGWASKTTVAQHIHHQLNILASSFQNWKPL